MRVRTARTNPNAHGAGANSPATQSRIKQELNMNTFYTPSSRTIKRLRLLALPLALASISGMAYAEDTAKMFTVGGFGTLGVTQSTIENGDFVINPFQPSGPGTKKSWSIGTDSLLAVQVDAKLNEQWSAVVQVVSSQTSDNNYRPHIEWANVKYAVTPDLSVRVGRIALPSFLVSETRLVGYANTPVRAPAETYSMYGLTNSDGIDGRWSHSFGGFTNTVQAWFGRASGFDTSNPNGSQNKDIWMRKMRGISDTLEKGALTVRASAHISKLGFAVAGLPNDLELGYKVYSLGAMYDPGVWFVQGEVAYIKRAIINPVVGLTPSTETAINALAGYRIDKFTPYLAHSRVNAASSVGFATREQRTTAAGVRWDLYKNVDIKMQFEHLQLGPKSTGLFTNVKPGLAGSSGNIASVVVDFIY